MTSLEVQIAQEAAELAAAPQTPLYQLQPKGTGAGRCHWCGQFDADLVEVEPGRFKGVHCCGQRHL